MSHYTVAVFCKPGDSVEHLLDPYDENLEIAPYIYRTREKLISDVRKQIKKLREDMQKYAEGKEQNPYWLADEHSDSQALSKYWSRCLSYENMSDDELADAYIKNDKNSIFDKDGNELSTYNPNSKWDWYSIGGRWAGLLKTKDGEEVDECLVSELDLSVDKNSPEPEFEHQKRFWEVVVEGKPLEEGEDKEDYFTIYKPEYYKETYGDCQTFCEKSCSFSTYALLDANGVWHEPGRMGWFACDDSTPDSRADYDKFFEDYLKNADPDWTVTVVDCHI